MDDFVGPVEKPDLGVSEIGGPPKLQVCEGKWRETIGFCISLKPIWRFPEIQLYPQIIHFNGIFPYESSIYGNPHLGTEVAFLRSDIRYLFDSMTGRASSGVGTIAFSMGQVLGVTFPSNEFLVLVFDHILSGQWFLRHNWLSSLIKNQIISLRTV